MADDASFTGSGGCGQRMAQEEPLDAILSPELDKMVTDGEFKHSGFELIRDFQKLIRSPMLCFRCNPRQALQDPGLDKTHPCLITKIYVIMTAWIKMCVSVCKYLHRAGRERC